MELDELHVGHPATCAPGGRNAIAGGGVGIGRVKVHLARAARCEDGVRRAEGYYPVGGLIQCIKTQAAIGLDAIGWTDFAAELALCDQVHQHVVLK